MPTPPLPVLHALLAALALPVRYPSTLSAVPPTLLLLLLERLTARLPLPPPLRSPRDRAAEIELTKILTGSLAVEVGMDLGAVDPARLVDGSEPDIAALVMALAVIARRAGLSIRLPAQTDEGDISWESLESAVEEAPAPSNVSFKAAYEGLGYDAAQHEDARTPYMPLARAHPSHHARSHMPFPADTYATPPRPGPNPQWGRDASAVSSASGSSRDPSRRGQYTSSGSASSSAWSSARGRTVLHAMVEEFGLSPPRGYGTGAG